MERITRSVAERHPDYRWARRRRPSPWPASSRRLREDPSEGDVFPRADVPTLQLSLPAAFDEGELVRLGRALAPLRDDGVLIVCSGNVVHNLGTLDPSETQRPPDWAVAFDHWVRDAVEAGDLDALIAWRTEAPHAALAHPTAEHLRPLFVAVGAGVGARVTWPITGFEHGSTSRRSLQLD